MERYTRLASSGDPAIDVAAHTASYVFSDPSVGRDRFVVKPDAWQIANYLNNPAFLWQHLDSELPIGRVFNLNVGVRLLTGSVKYAVEENRLARTVFNLVTGGFLPAVSTSWVALPGGVTRSNDPAIDAVFTKVDLLEISQVCIGALPMALLAAGRSIDLAPLRSWTEKYLDLGAPGMRRGELEAVHRACGPARTRSSATSREERVRRARELRRGNHMLTGEDRKKYERYDLLRKDFGFTLEQAAVDIGIAPELLRALVARGHHEDGNRREFQGTTSEGTTPTLAGLGYGGHKIAPEFRSGLEALGSHLDDALTASEAGRHALVKRHIRKAIEQHEELTASLKD